MPQRFRWDDDRAGWPSLEPGTRYPFRDGDGHVEILARKIRPGRARESNPPCFYTVLDTRAGHYEQNDFAVLNKIDYTAGEPASRAGEQLALGLGAVAVMAC